MTGKKGENWGRLPPQKGNPRLAAAPKFLPPIHEIILIFPGGFALPIKIFFPGVLNFYGILFPPKISPSAYSPPCFKKFFGGSQNPTFFGIFPKNPQTKKKKTVVVRGGFPRELDPKKISIP